MAMLTTNYARLGHRAGEAVPEDVRRVQGCLAARGIGIGIGGGGGGGDLSTRPIFYLKLHKAGSTTVTFALLLRCVLHVILGLKKQNTVICDV